MVKCAEVIDLLLGTGGRLDTVTALDHICLETDGTRATVQLEKEAASIAQDGTHLVATP